MEHEGPFEGHTDGVYRVVGDARGSVLATASWDGSLRLWDPVTRRPRKALLKPTPAGAGRNRRPRAGRQPQRKRHRRLGLPRSATGSSGSTPFPYGA
ncbi:WD40 repeat domain-containing protein [Nonomuraea sp. NPDC004186]